MTVELSSLILAAVTKSIWLAILKSPTVYLCCISYSKYLECKESAAPAAPTGSSRKCDPAGDKASKCTYTCDSDDKVTKEAKCIASTGKWDPTEIKLACPCPDSPKAEFPITKSPDVSAPVPAGTEITYKCDINGKESKIECSKEGTGKYSPEAPDLTCKGKLQN